LLAAALPTPARLARGPEIAVRQHRGLQSSAAGVAAPRGGTKLRPYLRTVDRALEGNPAGFRTRAFFIDGTSVRTAHSSALCRAFPPHAQGHWPVLRMLVAHDLETGLAMRPQWGPMYGTQAVSEQKLLEEAMDRLPEGSVLVGDANFGVFSVAYAAAQRDRPVVLRLTPVRALHLAGGPLQDGLDRALTWKPSRDDRRSHPALPADACVRGRLIARQVQPSDGSIPFLLCLFASLPANTDAVVELYGQRWNIETD